MPDALHPDLAWARSGAMPLCGRPEAAPRLAPGAIARFAERQLARLRERATALPATLDGPALLGERAARLGLRRAGDVSPGGACRLLRARDGWLAVSLARDADAELVPAWLEGEVEGPPGGLGLWRFVEVRLRGVRCADAVERARWLGLPVARAAAGAPPRGEGGVRVAARGPRRRPAPGATPLVVDLSSLWAGPLCTHLLALAGARVVKVECRRRPDGARGGDAGFFDLLQAGKRSVALDFTDPGDRRRLARLVQRADLVVESARPRALAQLGIDAAATVAAHPGTTWVSITGYGRDDAGVAFGDDAAAAAGLVLAAGDARGPLFCGDALADPLTGLRAASAAWEAWREGGGALLDVSLRDVAAAALAEPLARERATVVREDGGWVARVGRHREPVAEPRTRAAAGRARPLGVDTDAVLAEIGAC